MSKKSGVNWLLNLTFNNISVIYYLTAQRCEGGLKKLDLRSGSHAMGIWHVFNEPVQATTRRHLFTVTNIPRNRSIHFSRLLRRIWGYKGPIITLNQTGAECDIIFSMYNEF